MKEAMQDVSGTRSIFATQICCHDHSV